MRYEDWPDRLQCYMDSVANISFRYGKHDCCLFAGNAIKSITGVDVLEHLNYRQELKDYQKHKRMGVSILVEQILQKYMFKEVPVKLAGRGDVVLCDGDNGITAGVCMGSYVFLPGKSGLTTTSLLDGKRAWRIE